MWNINVNVNKPKERIIPEKTTKKYKKRIQNNDERITQLTWFD